LTWTPTDDQGPASYNFTVTVTDNGHPARSASQPVTVNTLAAGLAGGNLWIVGTSTNQGTPQHPGNDSVVVSSTNDGNTVSVTINGAASQFTIPTGGQIFVALGGGNDAVTIDEGAGTQLIGPAIQVDGGTGADMLTVRGTAAADAFGVTATTISLTGAGTITYANVETLAVDGGAGADSFTGTFASGFSGSLTLSNIEAASLSISGTLAAGSTITATDFTGVTVDTLAGTLLAASGSINGATIGTVTSNGLLEATETASGSGGVLQNVTIGSVAGSVLAGSLVYCKVGSVAVGGKVTAQGQGTTSNVSIGTLGGSFTAPEDGTPGSGVMSNSTINSMTSTGLVSTGSISGMSVGSTASGSSITAAGQGTTSNVSIGTLGGSFTAPEDSTPGSGVMSNSTINSITSTGLVSTGSISGMSVGSTASGSSITAAGQGTTSNVSIGTLGGSFTAPEDGTPGSGVMSNSTINSMTSTGLVSTGSISGMSVGSTASGSSITAAGQGTTSNVSIGTLGGSFTAPEDGTPGSGVMSNSTINSMTSTGLVSTGSISGMSVGSTASGSSITAAGQGTTSNVSIGTLGGSFTAPEDGSPGSGAMSNSTINSITSTGLVSTGSISGMSVGTTDSGSSITAAGLGTASNVSISKHSGTFTVKKDNNPGSGSLTNLTIGTLTVTGVVNADTASSLAIATVAGTISVTADLSSFTAGTVVGTATLSSGHFGTVTAQHASPFVQFIEPGVTRTVAATPYDAGGSVPDFSLYYDGTVPGSNPRVVVNINAANPGSFDLEVTTTSAATKNGAGFDLAGCYSVGNAKTGIHNLVVGGSLQPGVPGAAVVQLPQDIVAVAVAGNLPAGSILAKSVPAIAANSFAGVPADSAGQNDASVPLAAGVGVSQASGIFQVFFSEAGHVAQFLATGKGQSFDAKDMLFSDIVLDNAPVLAADKLVPTGSSTSVDSVVFTGAGASLATAQPIATSISALPGGSIGSLQISAPQGLTANVTADRILGNIDVTKGGISGVLQATVGDFGTAITDVNGTITGVTFVHAGGGGLTGKILAKGNLVSEVDVQSGLDGVVATDGDIGVIQTVGGVAKLNADGSLSRFGGIAVSTGGVNGQIIALGNVFGDIKITGGLSGRIAVQGDPGEFGLDPHRNGILGNVSISGGISNTGAVVSAGVIGDIGTSLTIAGADKGIIAAGGNINSPNNANIFESAQGANLSAINFIFSGSDLDVLNPTELNLIVQDLLALKVAGGI
jgi:hypothetical protein